jgi:uncharacterized protein (DUF3820 family)
MTIDNTETTDEKTYEYVGEWKLLFGKHKGTPFRSCPDDYLKWMWEKGVSNNDKVNEYISQRLNL